MYGCRFRLGVRADLRGIGERTNSEDEHRQSLLMSRTSRRKHRVRRFRLSGRYFGLHHVPVFDEPAVFDAEDVDSDHRLRCPADVTPMDHDDAALGHDHAWLVPKSFWKGAHKADDGIASVGNGRIVLDVVGCEELLDNARIALYENAPNRLERDRLAAFTLINAVHRSLLPQKAADSESEDRNAAACLVNDSGYWKSDPCPASGYTSSVAFGRFSASQYELRTGIISSWKPCTTRVGWLMPFNPAKRSPLNCSHSRNAAVCALATFGPEGGSRSSFRSMSLAMKVPPAAWLVGVGAKKS